MEPNKQSESEVLTLGIVKAYIDDPIVSLKDIQKGYDWYMSLFNRYTAITPSDYTHGTLALSVARKDKLQEWVDASFKAWCSKYADVATSERASQILEDFTVAAGL